MKIDHQGPCVCNGELVSESAFDLKYKTSLKHGLF
uniref:Ferredoxin n=1 Tax=Heterorhabditis bacteriophora TaxID=37862 RepID=A0A1I7WI35_HETBA